MMGAAPSRLAAVGGPGHPSPSRVSRSIAQSFLLTAGAYGASFPPRDALPGVPRDDYPDLGAIRRPLV